MSKWSSLIFDGWCDVEPSCWPCCIALSSQSRRTRRRRRQSAALYRRPQTQRQRRLDAAAPAAGGRRGASADDSCSSRSWRHQQLLPLLTLGQSHPVDCTASAVVAIDRDLRRDAAGFHRWRMSMSSLYRKNIITPVHTHGLNDSLHLRSWDKHKTSGVAIFVVVF